MRFLLAQDLGELARAAWAEHHLPPDRLFDQTPAALLALFFVPAARANGTDNVGQLRRLNDERAAKGKMPVRPSWLFPPPKR